MEISEFIWTEDRIAHIGHHNVEPEEFERGLFRQGPGLAAKSRGKNPVYYVLGQTEAGRHLFCVVISFPDRRVIL